MTGDDEPRLELVAVNDAPEPILHLPEDFWAARPVLAHIAQAARARMVSPDVVLGAVMARVAAFTPPLFEIPAVVKASSSLAWYVAATGRSGDGKSTANAVAGELVGKPRRGRADQLGVAVRPLGSGEGLVKAFLRMVDVDDGQGGTVRELQQVHYGVLMTLDEGAAVSALNGRNGSTLLATLRSMWTGGFVGNANASEETSRELESGAYVLSFVMGVQPELAASLLGDTAAGTPQRFYWCNALDPSAPDVLPDWPGPLDWRPPARPADGRERAGIVFPDDVWVEIIEQARARLRGELVVDPYDTHRHLLTLKAAALLAILDGRTECTDDDWALADEMVIVSSGVRDHVLGVLRTVEQLAEADEAARAGRRHRAILRITAEESERRRVELIERGCRLVLNAVEDRPFGQGQVNQAMGGRLRKELDPGEVIDALVGSGRVVRDGENRKHQPIWRAVR